MKAKDRTGQKYNRLLVLKRVSNNPWGGTRWLCRGDCENTKIVASTHLVSGGVKSCGCQHRSHLVGQKFNRLTVVDFDKIVNHEAYWQCLCDCGNSTIVKSENLLGGDVKSCGCLARESSRTCLLTFITKRGPKNHNYNHSLADEHRDPRLLQTWRYRNWRTGVYERDNFHCQKCHKRGERRFGHLHAHHVESWNNHAELRYEVSNGITLCAVCHALFHKKYGKGNNTSSQLSEFLGNSTALISGFKKGGDVDAGLHLSNNVARGHSGNQSILQNTWC
mgnify:CR=1 FL=1